MSAKDFTQYDLCAQQCAAWIVERGARALQHAACAFDYHGDLREGEEYHAKAVLDAIAEARALCDILEGKMDAALTPAVYPKCVHLPITTEETYLGDWHATDAAYDGAPDSNSPVGEGQTKQEAIDDLVEKIVSANGEYFDPDRLREDRDERRRLEAEGE